MVKHFYVDGACSTNGSWKGGYGVVQLEPNEKNDKYKLIYKYAEYCDNTTNNREELKAMIHVLGMAASDSENTYVIASDSAYVINILTIWGPSWAKNNWTKKDSKPILNLELIQEMYNLYQKVISRVEVVKVCGHRNVLGNELADALATNNINKWNKLYVL